MAPQDLTHWVRVTDICVSKLTIIGSDNGRRQAIIWTNAGILLIGPLGTNFRNIKRNSYIFIQENLFESVVCEMSAMLSRSQCVHNKSDLVLVTRPLPESMTVHFANTYMRFIAVTSQWARWRLKSPASRLFTETFIQAQIKENIKALLHWPLCGEYTGDRWIPHTNCQ